MYRPVSPRHNYNLSMGQPEISPLRETLQRPIGVHERASAYTVSSRHPSAPYLGTATGIHLRQEMRPMLAMSAKDPIVGLKEIYNHAEKRLYQRHGLEFEYAVVNRTQFPYLLEIGSPGLCDEGMIFVMEDFFVDLDADTQRRVVELIAVHEYGEIIFKSHHEGSRLEFAIAKEDNFLSKYLEILKEKSFLKFRDIVLHRMKGMIREELEVTGADPHFLGEMKDNQKDGMEGGSSSIIRAEKLKGSFHWPKELEERYAGALDEDEEIARERVKNWIQYIIVNEQSRGFLNKASAEALNAFKNSVQQGRSTKEALLPAAISFYGALGVFYSEMAEGLFSREFLEEEMMKKATDEAHTALLAGMRGFVEASELNEPQRAEALGIIERMPLLSRSFDVHLGINELENILLERLAKTKGDQTEAERDRILLWRIVEGIMHSLGTNNEAEAIGVALGLIAEVQEVREHLRTMKVSFSSQDPTLKSFRLEKEILWRLAHCPEELRKSLARLPNTTLQSLVDEEIEGVSQGEEEIASVAIDIGQLRQAYRKDLSAYDQPKNEPESSYKRHLQQRYGEAENQKTRDQIVEELVNLFGGDIEKKVSHSFACGEISTDLAKEILQNEWKKSAPLKYQLGGDSDWFFYLLKNGRVPEQERRDLFCYRLLKTPFLQKNGTSPVILEALADLPVTYWLGQEMIDQDANLVEMIPQFLRGLAADLAKSNREALLLELEDSFADRKITLMMVQGLDSFLKAYVKRPVFLYEFRHIHLDAQAVSEGSMRNFLRLVSLQDWEIFETTLAKIQEAERPDIGSFLISLDRKRREELKLAVLEGSDTVVDRNALLRLAAVENLPLNQIVSHCRNLIGTTDPEAKDLVARFDRNKGVSEETSSDRSALHLFLTCGIPYLEKASRELKEAARVRDELQSLSKIPKRRMEKRKKEK